MARAYPINSPSDAVLAPGVNDYDLLRVPTELLTEGVIRGFAVTERGAGANMSVDVSAGLSLIEITNTNVSHGRTYKTWFEETVTTNLSITTADSTNPRKDRVVLRIDVATDPNAAASNIAIIEVLAGTPAGSPSAPAEPANAITLAIIDVPASDTSITNSQITDSRTFVELDPDVLADVVRADDLASTANGEGASGVGVEDAGGFFDGDTVEEVLQELGSREGVPTGTMLMWLTNTAPDGFLLCYGQAISRTTYAGLFDVIGTSFGTGDGSTTFNLPDMRGRFPLGQDDMGGSAANRVTDTDADTIGGADGAESVTLTVGQLPSHTHDVTGFVSAGGGTSRVQLANLNTTGATASAAATATGSGEAHNNMPPYITVNYVIKT